MDNQQQQRINRAAQEFTDALVAAYKTTSDSTVVAQQLGAKQIEYFFDTVISNLRTQAEGTLQVTQQLADQQELARESVQDLAQISTDNYMDLLDSMFSFYQGGTSRTQRRAEEAQRRVEEAEARAEEAQIRAEEAERIKSEAERRTEEAKRSTEEAQRRVEEAEKGARAAQRRAREAERSTEEAEKRAEEAERRSLETQRRAEETERSRSEAENQRDAEEGDNNTEATLRSQSQWVRTSGRSKVRGRNTGSRGRSSRRR
jgi:DNA repair exonuclease SbcCD ATPase subunit